jgi:hypothetical protein
MPGSVNSACCSGSGTSGFYRNGLIGRTWKILERLSVIEARDGIHKAVDPRAVVARGHDNPLVEICAEVTAENSRVDARLKGSRSEDAASMNLR